MIAVYAGTFDPMTAGHLSVVRLAARLFAHVRVLVAVNPDKRTVFSEGERVDLARELTLLMPNVSVASTRGLVVDHARGIGASYLVRGLRDAGDAGFETELARLNRKLAPDLTTLILPAEPDLESVSSSVLKARVLAGQSVTDLCPPHVADELGRRLRRELP